MRHLSTIAIAVLLCTGAGLAGATPAGADTSPTVEDTTGPSIGARFGGTVGNFPWFISDIEVTWEVIDEDSAITSTSGCDTFVISVDGPVQTYTCTATSGGGTTSLPVDLGRDTTPPVLNVPTNRTATTTGTSAVVTWPAPTATDNLTADPVETCSHASGSTFPLGTTTVTCTATDDAGNVTTGTFTITVTPTAQQIAVTMRAPIDPAPVVNTARVTRIVPVRTTFTVNGRSVTGSTSQPLYVGTPVAGGCSGATRSDAVETFAGSRTSGNAFRWNPSLRRWVYNLDQRAFGLTAGTCYRVPIFYGGSVVRNVASGGTLVGWFYLRPTR